MIQRLKNKLEKLQAKRAELYRGGFLIQSMQLNSKIAELEELIKGYEWQPLGDIIDIDKPFRNKLNLQLLKLLLFADVMQDTATDIKGLLREKGVSDMKLCQQVEEIRSIASKIVRIVDQDQLPNLSKGFEDDDKVIRDIQTLATLFINEKFTYQ